MTGNYFSKRWSLTSRLPVKNIGIIYCTSTKSALGRESEKLADGEIIEVADAIRSVLMSYGFQVELVDLDPKQIKDLNRFDWVFNLAESIDGYPLADYEVASKLEQCGIKFTGSGSKTLRNCLDKAATKSALLLNGIGTPSFEVFQPGKPILNFLNYPLFVKPARQDSSVGINDDAIVGNDSELKDRVEKIHRLYHQAALVEQYINGRDINAAVIGNGDQAVVLPLSEVFYPELVGPKFMTFNGKWVSDSLDYKVSKAECPSNLPPEVETKIKDIALRTYQALGCRDYARVDFRLQGECPLVLEVNPNPCIHPVDSGFVRSGKAAGFSYADLVIKILENSVHNHNEVMAPGFLEVAEYQENIK